MRHVDEGELHAYLDNTWASADEHRRAIDEHMAECAECRARLEEARRLRERARTILRAADPAEISAPPYEQIIARARQRGRSRAVRPGVALAWAASVALAVTVGWYARTLIGRRPEAPQLARSSPIEAAPPTTPQSAHTEPAAATKQLADAAPARAREGREVAARGPANRAAAQQVAVERKEAPSAVATGETVTAKARTVDAMAPTAKAPAPAAALGPPQARMAAPVVNEAGWITVSEAEAERRLGGPIAHIPDLATLGYSVSGSGDGTVVHAIQVLAPGITLDLYQQRATAVAEERAASRAARPNVRALREEAIEPVSVDWEGYRVTARAAVPADSLRRLLARLRVPR